MKAMVIREFGGVEGFEQAEVAKPEVKAGHVLVRIASTSVNTIDMMIREMGEGLPFSPQAPAVLGMDFAGVVEAVGEGITEFKAGDEVFGCAGGLGDLPGTLAEYILADVNLIAHKPKNLSMTEAAALPLVGITAFEGLQRAGISQGQKVLVHGAAGGVGHVAVQLARHFGAEVYGTGSAGEQAELIESLGATAIDFKAESVADYVAKHTDSEGFDVIFDSVGGANLNNSIEAAKLNGQIATTLSFLELDLSMVHMKGLSLHVVFMLIPMIHNKGREEHGKILEALAKIAEAGELKPVLDSQRFALTEVAEAHNRLASGQAMGKVMIDIA
ncbi:zinc-dependent alcohol dehydrogenase family protein [Photobacterium sp. BZF1]|uniref:zinc-dependent alcohol dehydrogenase family protein n=1 Tax=Photobacterium TaxID=657 RepID=UPI0016536185|nr:MULTISPECIES: zinc-dependent alcohol dehydrogenase family protein [Photobacterium]MBC7005257.1 zinc-dependent alcohol dehydrogenase family protein [Photobacterium sp. BZF1]MBY5945552.1 zinc-dependent alcohol dehydrogenase family protein [Photobacterium rosenbergii]